MEIVDIYLGKIQKDLKKQKQAILFTVIMLLSLVVLTLLTLFNVKVIIFLILFSLFLLLILKVYIEKIVKKENLKDSISFEEKQDNVNLTIKIDKNIISYKHLKEKLNRYSVFIEKALSENDVIVKSITFNLVNKNDIILSITEKDGVYINISKGLLLKLSDEEIKSVISHELSHYIYKDYYIFKSSYLVFTFTQRAIIGSLFFLSLTNIIKIIIGLEVSSFIYLAFITHFVSYFIVFLFLQNDNLNSRHSMEYRADLTSVKLFKQEGLNLKSALEKILEEKESDIASDSHPRLKDRIELIEKGAIL